MKPTDKEIIALIRKNKSGYRRSISETDVIKIYKMAYNTAIDHAAENAESEYGYTIDTHKVDKQSITKHKYEI